MLGVGRMDVRLVVPLQVFLPVALGSVQGPPDLASPAPSESGNRGKHAIERLTIQAAFQIFPPRLIALASVRQLACRPLARICRFVSGERDGSNS
jgi:hypothetical protein